MVRWFLPLLGFFVVGCGHAAARPKAHVPEGQRIYRTALGPSPHAPGFGHEPVSHLPMALPPTATPSVEMFDTVTLATVPSNPRVLAGYTSGYWPTYAPLRQRYPHARVKSIAISRSHVAECLDIEPGDAVPSQAPGWYWAMKRAGIHKPCLYTSLSEWQEVFRYMGGIPRSSYWAWDAHYDYFRHIDAGFDGTQWTDRAYGRNLDESTITLAFAGLTKPKPSCDRACRQRKQRERRAREHRHLVALYRERAQLRRHIDWLKYRLGRVRLHIRNSRCGGRHYRHACQPVRNFGAYLNHGLAKLRARGAAVNTEIRVLRSRGIR